MISLILTLAFISLIVWLIVTYVAKTDPIRTIIIAVAVICVLIYLMRAFGIVDIPVPQLR